MKYSKKYELTASNIISSLILVQVILTETFLWPFILLFFVSVSKNCYLKHTCVINNVENVICMDFTLCR